MRCLVRLTLSAIMPFVVLSGCQPPTPEAGPEIIAVTGPYLGQEPPGMDPVPFASDTLGAPFDVRDTAWMPSGSQLFYTVWGRSRGTIVTISRETGSWGASEIAPFSGRYPDLEAFVTPAGDELYFVSKRPLEAEGGEKDWDIWMTRQSGEGWTEPENLGPVVNTDDGEYFPSLTAEGTLYFTARREDSLGGEDIYRSRRLPEGDWAEPENLGPAINSPGPEYNALIAPDESFLIFGSVREGDVGGGDLHIAFRDEDGTWLPARNMGEPINSPAIDYCPALTPDGRYFFFTSGRTPDGDSRPLTYDELAEGLRGPFNGSDNLWWVDARVIDQLRVE